MKFSYYFGGVRHTDTGIEFLQELTKECEDPQAVIDGIIESERRFNEVDHDE